MDKPGISTMCLFTATTLAALLALPVLPVLAQSLGEGLSALDEGDAATALQHFEPLAEQGDAAVLLGHHVRLRQCYPPE